MIRTFIGIEFSDEVKDGIIQAQNMVRSKSIKGRWKYIKNFHLTLKFLGDVKEEDIERIYQNMMDRIDVKRFDITAHGIGSFKGRDCLRVVFMDIVDGKEGLQKLSAEVDDACFDSGFKRENKGFTPHITIAQDVVLNDELRKLSENINRLPMIIIPIFNVSIIKSSQENGRRIYETIKRVPLAK